MTIQKELNVAAKNGSKSWDNKTRFVVYGQVFLFFVAWMMALGRLVMNRFWNAKFNVEEIEVLISTEKIPKDMVHFVKKFVLSYFTKRYVMFFPHIVGAILWWNLYFLQLIPSIRQKYRKFHRILGRVLMVCAIAQTISGAGLAYMGNSSTIKLVSYLLAIAVAYCVYNGWYFAAIEKDIPKHKYWSMRLVGYLQTIALQRVCMVLLIISRRTGWPDLYPAYDPTDTATTEKLFEDSFTFCMILAMMFTEWYLASYYGWTESPKNGKGETKEIEAVPKE